MEQKPPVIINEELELPVVGWGRNNDPVMKIENYTLFVKNVEGKKFGLNAKLRVKVTKVFAKYGFVEIIEKE